MSGRLLCTSLRLTLHLGRGANNLFKMVLLRDRAIRISQALKLLLLVGHAFSFKGTARAFFGTDFGEGVAGQASTRGLIDSFGEHLTAVCG